MASQDWLEKDFYKTLGVSKDVSDTDLKKAYRKLARKYHPDANPGDAAAEAKFKEISEAYSVLSNADERKEYDAIRAMGSNGARFHAGPGGPGGQQQGFEDVFSGLFNGAGGPRVRYQSGGGMPGGGYEDIFSMFNGAGGSQFRGTPAGQDMTAQATIPFAEAIEGATVTLATADGHHVKTRIPAGVKDGQKIRLRGKGGAGNPPGDMIITVHVKEHPVFKRDGDNLRVTVPITMNEAALGATIEVPTFDGPRVKVKVPEGTPSGRTLRVRGKGVATKKRTGDLLVTVEVAVPTKLSNKAKEALAAFAEAVGNESPRDDLYRRAATK